MANASAFPTKETPAPSRARGIHDSAAANLAESDLGGSVRRSENEEARLEGRESRNPVRHRRESRALPERASSEGRQTRPGFDRRAAVGRRARARESVP